MVLQKLRPLRWTGTGTVEIKSEPQKLLKPFVPPSRPPGGGSEQPKPSVIQTKARPRPGPLQNGPIHREGEPEELAKLLHGSVERSVLSPALIGRSRLGIIHHPGSGPADTWVTSRVRPERVCPSWDRKSESQRSRTWLRWTRDDDPTMAAFFFNLLCLRFLRPSSLTNWD